MDKEVKVTTKTLNDLREEYGMPPIPGGDVPFAEVQGDIKTVKTKEEGQEEEKQEKKVFYLCDGKACTEKRSCYTDGGFCKHTSDISHAINFHRCFVLEEAGFCENELTHVVDEAIEKLEENILEQIKDGHGVNASLENKIAWLSGLADVKEKIHTVSPKW